MNKPVYSDYIRHAIRFYARYHAPKFRTEVDRVNWWSCHNVIQTYSDRDRAILIYVYGEFDTLGDNVYAIATKYHIHQNIIWDMMKEFERQVAIERGLWV